MNCKIQKSKLKGRIVCPSNKKHTHRAIFLQHYQMEKVL